jgi:hypothetical protein
MKELKKIGRVIAQVDSPWLPIAAARFPTHIRSCGIFRRQSGNGTCFLWVLRFPLPIIPPTAPHSLSIIRTGIIGQTVADVPSGLSLTPLQETKNKHSLFYYWYFCCYFRLFHYSTLPTAKNAKYCLHSGRTRLSNAILYFVICIPFKQLKLHTILSSSLGFLRIKKIWSHQNHERMAGIDCEVRLTLIGGIGTTAQPNIRRLPSGVGKSICCLCFVTSPH